ncbi:MAG TPA: UdgX family uracil-DNA binding protein [Solirubrobacterales bacterium]|nr:UdgX family uracil-DNA binding protein [Solirubrobacterales bacterium]
MATKQLPLDGTEASGAEALIPARPTLPRLREAAANCRACPLWENATQTVFGEGLKRARVMLIGEQPGDREDREGKPFVGPAGGVLDKALDEAGIERADAYVTNVVKHFKWEARGKRRIHQAPKVEEIKACAPWIEAEIEVVDPDVLVCLGATAVRAMIGSKHRVMRDHGQFVETKLGRTAVATLHPSAILRADDEDREEAMRMLVDDLRRVRDRLDS